MIRFLSASVLMLIIFPVLFIANLNISIQLELSNNEESQIHEPIIIKCNEEFEDQNWPGNGTRENPYIIENIRIESSTPCIVIENTRKHFVIRNCYLWRRMEYLRGSLSGSTVHFSNITNGIIMKCKIESIEDALEMNLASYCNISQNVITSYPIHYSSGEGVILEQIVNCTVSHNIIYNLSSGILLNQAYHSRIENNTIVQNGVGLGLGDNNQTLVTNNTIVSNSEGIIVSGNNNIIFGNRIGSNGYMTVRDYGEFNQWDDNISIGNGWFDYNGLGVYIIPGLANSVDHYPWLCNNFNYTIEDCFGPLIRFWPWVLVTMTQAGPHETHFFTASVNDYSGVDSVLVYYRLTTSGPFTCLEMNFTPSEQHPHAYSYTLEMSDPYDITLYYYYWANDSLGNFRQAPMDKFRWNLYRETTPETPFDFTILVVLTLGIIVILVTIYRKHR